MPVEQPDQLCTASSVSSLWINTRFLSMVVASACVVAVRLHAKGVPEPVQSEDRPSQRLLCVLLGTGVGAVGNSGQKLPLPTSWLGLGLW